MSDAKGAIACCVCVGTIIVVASLIGNSVVTVDDGQNAVTWSDVTQEFLGTKGPGLHFSHPSVQAALYSRRVVAKDVNNAHCLTNEGIEASLSLEAQYTYEDGDSLQKVFREVGEDAAVWAMVDSVARHAIEDACGNITAIDLYSNRAMSELLINSKVVSFITKHVPGVIGQNAPVRNINLPDRLLVELQKKDDMIEQVELIRSTREPVLIEVRTTLYEASFQANSTLAAARAERDRVIYKAKKDEDTTIRSLETLAENLAVSMKELGMTPEELLEGVLQTQQRGDEQSRAMQLCLRDCVEKGFNCGTCYLTLSDSGSGSPSLIISQNP